MRVTRLADVEPYDSLYVASETGLAVLSCPGRIAAEIGRGLRVLVVSLFDSAHEEGRWPSAAVLARIGVDVLQAGLPSAPERSPLYGSWLGRSSARDPVDDAWLDRAAAVLEEAGRRSRARHVYLPLGLDGQIDQRLAHEAAVRSFEPKAERDVLLYEDRPAAFVRGMVRVRLAQLGARLPPAATVAARSGPLRFLLRLQRAPQLHGQLRGPGERLGYARLAMREWSAARGWDPRRARGLRLQPVLQRGAGDGSPAAADLLGESRRFGRHERLAALAAEYAKELGGGPGAERYWLLLPVPEEGALAGASPPA